MANPTPCLPLFVCVKDIMRLTGKKESTCRKIMRDIRKQYGIAKPIPITADILCDYYKISLEQYYSRIANQPAFAR